VERRIKKSGGYTSLLCAPPNEMHGGREMSKKAVFHPTQHRRSRPEQSVRMLVFLLRAAQGAWARSSAPTNNVISLSRGVNL